MRAAWAAWTARIAWIAWTASIVIAPVATAQAPITLQQVMAAQVPPPDFKVRYGTDSLQFGHLRLPKRPGPHPVVVFVHGGCWLSQYDIGYAASLEQALADSGYAVWSLEYRRVGNDGGGWPGTFSDIARGTDHLRELAKTHALDLSRVVASGHSAGGQLALWLAARGRVARSSEVYVDDPLPIRGVLGLAPAPDLEGLHAAGTCGQVIHRLIGGSPVERPERYAAVSPMQLSPVGVRSVHIVGAEDASWRPIGLQYYAHAASKGDTVQRLIEAPGAGHFDVVAPSTATWPLVMQALRSLFSAMR